MTATDTLHKYAFIDAARGVAILLVILVHATVRTGSVSPFVDWLGSYGNMGVQLFFVASAYTLCLSHVQRRAEPSAMRSYFIRRFFRIAPLYYLAIALYFALNLARGHGDASYLASYTPLNVLANVLFFHGLVHTASITMVPGGWSIGTEMLFYAMFPAMFWIADRLEGWKRNTSLLLVAVALALDFALQPLFWTDREPFVVNNSFMYGHILNQLPVFALGVFAFFHESRQATLPSPARSSLPFLMATVIALAVRPLHWQFTFVLAPCLSAVAFFYLLRVLRGIRSDQHLLARIGRVSFSMYIFHFPIVHYVSEVMNLLQSRSVNANVCLLCTWLLGTAATYAVATVSQRFIEGPGIRFGARLIRRLDAHSRSDP